MLIVYPKYYVNECATISHKCMVFYGNFLNFIYG